MTVLEQHLAEVGQRYRRADQWRYSAWLFVIAAFVGLWLFYLQISAKWMHQQSGWYLLLGGLVGAIAIAVLVTRRYRNIGWIADRVEENYPELDQRLATSLDEIKKNDGKPLGYLQHTVLLETVSHAHNNRWKNIVSEQSMRGLRTKGLFGFGLMLAAAICLMRFQPPQSAFAAQLNALQESELEEPVANFEVLVEPGDIEIERGENLVVVARFGNGSIPKSVELLHQGTQTNSNVTASSNTMTQSLNDPLYGGTIYDVREPLEYFVKYDSAETKRYRIGVFVLPELVRSDAALEFPSYTELPKKYIEDTRRVSAVEGSLLTWNLHVNKPDITATLVPTDDEAEEITLEVDSNNPQLLTASMRLTKTQSWNVKLVDKDGRENRSQPKLSVRVSPNKPPKLKLEMARDARVSPIEEFLVKATVSDDYGLEKAGITYTLQGEEKEVVLVEDGSRKEKKEANYVLDFEAFNAEPDQLLSYHFWAEDRAGDNSQRRTLSDMYFTEVRHFEEIFRQGQQPPGGQQQQQQQQQQAQSQNEQNAEQLAELQKQIINASWNLARRPVNDQFSQNVSVIVESQQSAIQQANEMSEELEDAESKDHLLQAQQFMQQALSELSTAYADKSIKALRNAVPAGRNAYEALLKLRAREHEVVQQQQQQQPGQQSQSSSRQRFQQQLDQLQLQNDQNRYETQREAQEEQDQEQQEMRRALNQLKELAQRQEDLNKQLKELQNALEQAESDEEKEEIERQLERLREQQQEMLRDTDELMDRLENQDQEAMQQAQEQLEQTRENMREASESLQRGAVTPALASGTRAQRELEEMREELRRQSANQFSEQMREMRDQAREIEKRQEELGQQLNEQQDEATEKTGLRAESGDQNQQANEELQKELQEQRRRVNQLLEEMKQTVQEAEESEPLLAEDLYDAFREAEKNRLEEKLEATERLTQGGLNRQAGELEQDVREGISELREEIDRAADRVLGDQSEALRLAIQTLKDLENELQNEMEQFGGERDPEAQDSASDQNQPGRQPAGEADANQEAQPGQPGEGGQRDENPAQEPSSERQPGGRQSNEQDRSEQEQQPGPQQQPGGQGQQPGEQGQQPGEQQQQPGQQPGEQQNAQQQGGGQGSGQQQEDAETKDHKTLKQPVNNPVANLHQDVRAAYAVVSDNRRINKMGASVVRGGNA